MEKKWEKKVSSFFFWLLLAWHQERIPLRLTKHFYSLFAPFSHIDAQRIPIYSIYIYIIFQTVSDHCNQITLRVVYFTLSPPTPHFHVVSILEICLARAYRVSLQKRNKGGQNNLVENVDLKPSVGRGRARCVGQDQMEAKATAICSTGNKGTN